MTDLTEKWKKGELPVSEYYLLYKDGTTDREYYDWANVYGRVTEKGFSTDPNDIVKVLAEVPSYEEWKAKLEENTKLKELLKEAEKIIWEVMDCREDREFYKDLANEYYTKRSKMK